VLAKATAGNTRLVPNAKMARSRDTVLTIGLILISSLRYVAILADTFANNMPPAIHGRHISTGSILTANIEKRRVNSFKNYTGAV
jgi:hypothetical protein